MFAVRGTDLVLLDRKPSGGQMPVSVAVNGIHVYVVNAGGTPNISGFIIDPSAVIWIPLPSSQRPLAGGTLAMPGISASTRTAAFCSSPKRERNSSTPIGLISGDTPQGRYRTPPAA